MYSIVTPLNTIVQAWRWQGLKCISKNPMNCTDLSKVVQTLQTLQPLQLGSSLGMSIQSCDTVGLWMICTDSTIIHIKKNNTILIFDFQFIPNVSLLLTTVAMLGYNQMYEYLNTIMISNHNTNCITLWLTTLIGQHEIFVKFYNHHIIMDHKLYMIHCPFIVPI